MPPKAKRRAVRRRPAGARGALRRPAAVPVAVAPVVAPRKLADLDMAGLQKLGFIVLRDAGYYGRKVALCGQVTGVRMVDRQLFLELRATGTQDDVLLRALTGKPSRKMEIHVCDPGCAGVLENELMVHGQVFEETERNKEEWFTNVEHVVPMGDDPDELARLRRAAGEQEAAPNAELAKKGGEPKEGRATPKDSKRRRDDEAEEDDEEVGRKTQAALFSSTGLDPDVKMRTKFLRRARRLGKSKKKKKKKKDSGSESSSGSSSSSSVESTVAASSLFSSEKKIKTLWRKFPGALTYHSLKEARGRLLTSTGAVWDTDQKAVVPIFVYYARQNLMGGMSAPMGQETLTVAMALDLMIQGKAAAATDLLSQRLKALETLSRGGHWSVARQHELCRLDDGGIAGDEESRTAAKEAREEEKVRSLLARPQGGKPGEGQSYGSKGKKGKDTKGAGKGKSDEGHKGKAEGRKEDNSQSWQKNKK